MHGHSLGNDYNDDKDDTDDDDDGDDGDDEEEEKRRRRTTTATTTATMMIPKPYQLMLRDACTQWRNACWFILRTIFRADAR